MRFESHFRAAVVTALLLGVAAPASAQNQRPIRRAEAATVQAANLYDLVARLRPEWLWAGGNPDDPTLVRRVRVYQNGVLIGSVHALRGKTTEHLHSVRIAGPERARAMDPRAYDIVAVLLVQYEDPSRTQAPPRRFQLTVGVGDRQLLDRRAEASLRDEGWLANYGRAVWTHASQVPVSLNATASMRLRGNVGIAGNVIRTSSSVRGVKPIGQGGGWVANDFTTLDIAATGYAGTRFLRLGMGPALRLLEYRQGSDPCGCTDPREGTGKALGAAADLTLTVPPTGPISVQLNVAGRWFAPHEIPRYFATQPPVELGGLALYTTIGVGFGF